MAVAGVGDRRTGKVTERLTVCSANRRWSLLVGVAMVGVLLVLEVAGWSSSSFSEAYAVQKQISGLLHSKEIEKEWISSDEWVALNWGIPWKMEQSPAMKFPFIFTDESNRALVGQRASLNWSWRLCYGGQWPGICLLSIFQQGFCLFFLGQLKQEEKRAKFMRNLQKLAGKR